jgi:hypothetical protein
MTKGKSLSDEASALGDPDSPESLRREMRKLAVQLSKANHDAARAESSRQQAEADLLLAQSQLETYLHCSDKINPRTLEKLKKHGGGKATAIICANDWHVEANIEHEVAGKVNQFNLDIARSRIERTWRKSLYMLDFSRKISNIRDCVLWLGGDLINGYIHPELEESNFLGPTDACLWVIDQLAPGIDLLLREADIKQLVIPTSRGNHGRSTQKKRISTDYRTSWEHLVYNMLARYYRLEPRVQFVIERGYHTWLDVQGHGVRFHHGDAIKFGGGVGGVHIPLRKKIAQWNKMGRTPLFDLLGHFHQYIDEWYYVISGCLCGFDGYALDIGAEYQRPTQAFIVVDKQYGKVITLPMICEAA